jgi:O-antigen ligase
MMDSIADKSKRTALYSLFGYFLSTTFSHALGQIFYGLALLLVIISIIGERKHIREIRLDLFSAFVLLFVGWSALSALLGSTPVKSLLILKEEWLFLMIAVAAYLVRDEATARSILRLFVVSAIIISFYAIWQHFTGLDLYHGTKLAEAPSSGYRVVGTFTHRLTFGNYYAVASIFVLGCTPFIEGRFNKILFYFGFASMSLATVFTYGRGPILSLLAGFVVFLFLTGKKSLRAALPVAALVLVLIAAASPDILSRYTTSAKTEWEGEYAGSRLSIWRSGIRMALDNPVLGVGPGNFKNLYALYRDQNSDRIYGHAHNDLINISAYAGFPAAVFYIGFWVVILVKMVRRLKARPESNMVRGVITGAFLATIVFCLTSFYEATFADEEIRLLLMAIWGLFFGITRAVKEGNKRTENIERA